MSATLTLRRPDDWHLHLRDGEQLRSVVGFTAQRFGRAIVMPNLKPPVTTVQMARAYRQRILDALPVDCSFEPLMTLYLTEQTTPAEIEASKRSGFIHGAKLYPAGATTHSDAGVRSVEAIYPVLERMEAVGLVLQVHGEVTDPGVDVFERETRFIETSLSPVIERFRKLKVVFEHITTRDGALFVRDAHPGVAATITPQHLLLNRNALFQGGLRPHLYCLPVLKTERDRETLLEAATSGNPKFFLGTDSAPHARGAKESDCGCAGIFSAHAGIELYAEAFDAAGKLDQLQGFASEFGADFYGLARNGGSITLVKQPWEPPATYPFAEQTLVPMRAAAPIQWRLHGGGC
ncbi:MAG TPA: dihydroorotase [Steroidobacteraceae bacterium]|nr:dihydroorotase [Steroidobacteraceae bacterium]